LPRFSEKRRSGFELEKSFWKMSPQLGLAVTLHPTATFEWAIWRVRNLQHTATIERVLWRQTNLGHVCVCVRELYFSATSFAREY